MLNLYNVNSHGLEKPENNLSPKEDKSQKEKYIKYTDPTGDFSGRELKWSMWYERNKLLLHRITVWFLIILSVIVWGIGLWKWGDYLIFGLTESVLLEQQASRTINYLGGHTAREAQPVQILGVSVFPNSTQKNDAVAEVTNPNKNFIVRFDYYFDFGGTKTPMRKGLLLAGETKPVVELGLDSTVYYGSGNLVLENIAWSRVDNHKIKDALTWQNNRLNFVVSDFKYVSKSSAAAGDASAVQFTLTNDTAYGYVEASFLAGLYQSDTLVGVLPFTLDKIIAGQAVLLDLRTFSPNLSVSEVRIYPLIDLYNEEVYLQPEK